MEEIFKLLKRDWPYLAALAIVLTLSVIVGVNLTAYAPEYAKTINQYLGRHFGPMVKFLEHLPLYQQIIFIFYNNLVASLVAILLGLTMIPLLPLLVLVGNGLIIGYVQRLAEPAGIKTGLFYLSLLPHGIFELSAFLIAVFLGIRFSLVPYRLLLHYLRTKEYRPFFKEYLKELRYYLPLLLALLALAAVIEMTVSPLLLGRGKIT